MNIIEVVKYDYLNSFKVIRAEHKYNTTHRLSHQKLKISFWHIYVKKIQVNAHFKKINLIDIPKYPFPKPLQEYFNREHI